MLVNAIIVGRVFAAIRDQLRGDRGKASSDARAKNRGCLPLRTGDNTKEGLGLNTDFSASSEAVASRPLEPAPERNKLDEFKGAVSEACARNRFRIQFLGGAAGEGPEIVEEAQICAPNVFTAFRAAEHSEWPPGATGLRILDNEGRDVFWRRKPGTGSGYEFHLSVSSGNATADQFGRIMK